jgi:hypothetical protein
MLDCCIGAAHAAAAVINAATVTVRAARYGRSTTNRIDIFWIFTVIVDVMT